MMRFVHGKRFASGNYNVRAKMPASTNQTISGTSEQDKVCNIYDLAGSAHCLTAELADYGSGNPRPVVRKMDNNNGVVCPSWRYTAYGWSVDMTNNSFHTRAALFVF